MTSSASLSSDPSTTETVRSKLEAVRLQLELLTDPALQQDAWHFPTPTSPKEYSWLGSNHDEVSELAAVLREAAPKLGLRQVQPASSKAIPRRPSYELSHSLKERVKNAVPLPIGPQVVDWSRLTACISSEMIKLEDSSPTAFLQPPSLLQPRPATAGSEMLEINSGGRVLFCLFAPPLATPPSSRASSPIKPPPNRASQRQWQQQQQQQEGPEGVEAGEGKGEVRDCCSQDLLVLPPAAHALSADCTLAVQQEAELGSGGALAWGGGAPMPLCVLPPPAWEHCLVVKFLPSRLLTQSEQFANELTRHCGICAPETRILRREGATEEEWQCAAQAAQALRDRYPDLHEEMGRSSCMLVMELIPGRALFKSREAWTPGHLTQTSEDLGRLVTLDMLLGNADRLPCEDLGWRGNLENVLFASSGTWANRLVAIDAVVQRRPPGALHTSQDAACEKLAELALNDLSMAGSVLREAVGCSRVAVAAADREDVVKAFQRGLKAALGASMGLKGLLEMMFEVVSEWIDGFLADIENTANITSPFPSSRRASTAGGPIGGGWDPNTTFKIRMISHEAQHNQNVSEKVAHWKAVFREKGEELRHAVEEWQLKRATAGPRLTTGFLDGTNPIVDMYELKVRLEHMLQRLRVLQDAASTARPTRLLPRLYLSGAVEANSHHLLRYLGVTHVLNATEDLLLPEPSEGFATLRCPLRDVVEEDISQFFPAAVAFIDQALAGSTGGVLVHCHGGRSRSVSLVLAWLMVNRRWTLRRALEWVQRQRPEAAPNAGYMAALARLEEELFGEQTVKVRRTKPELKVCPLCGEKVGLSAESVRLHLRVKHQMPSEALGSPMADSTHGSLAGSFPNSPGPGTAVASPMAGASPLGGLALHSARLSMLGAAMEGQPQSPGR